jgi:hypothetical protein
MSDPRSLLERESRRFIQSDGAFERLLRRRDRKRRNQRVAAGFVGIAVFVAAVWIVATGGVVDRSTPAVPGSGPTPTAPPPARASAAPDVVTQQMCSDGAGSRLEVTDIDTEDRINVRVEVYRSPVGHSWSIVLQQQTNPLAHWPSAVVIFEGTRVASESGDLAVQRRVPAHTFDGFRAKAVDTLTGQVCKIPRKGFYCRADRPCADDRSRDRST